MGAGTRPVPGRAVPCRAGPGRSLCWSRALSVRPRAPPSRRAADPSTPCRHLAADKGRREEGGRIRRAGARRRADTTSTVTVNPSRTSWKRAEKGEETTERSAVRRARARRLPSTEAARNTSLAASRGRRSSPLFQSQVNGGGLLSVGMSPLLLVPLIGRVCLRRRRRRRRRRPPRIPAQYRSARMDPR
jgi:hypothetical protein